MKRSPAVICALLLLAACDAGAPELPGGRPSPPRTQLELGLRLLKHNQAQMALNAFNRSLAEEGVSAGAMTGAGVAMARLHRRKDAERFLRGALDLDPNSVAAHNALGVLLYDEGDYAAAAAELQTALTLTDGADPSIATNLGIVETALANAKMEDGSVDDFQFDLVQYGGGVYRLEPRPNSERRIVQFAP